MLVFICSHVSCDLCVPPTDDHDDPTERVSTARLKPSHRLQSNIGFLQRDKSSRARVHGVSSEEEEV